MKRLVRLFVLVFIIGLFICTATGESLLDIIQNAEKIDWVGTDHVLVFNNETDTGTLYNMSYGTSFPLKVFFIEKYGDKTIAYAEDFNIYIVDKEGTKELIPCGKVGSWYTRHDHNESECLKRGFFLYEDMEGIQHVYNITENNNIELPRSLTTGLDSIELQYDKKTDKIWIVLNEVHVFDQEGKEVKLDGAVVLADADYNYIHNGKLCLYYNGHAAILDLTTQERIEYKGYTFQHYDGQCQIFDDDTAILVSDDGNPGMVIDLQGNTLFVAPDGGHIADGHKGMKGEANRGFRTVIEDSVFFYYDLPSDEIWHITEIEDEITYDMHFLAKNTITGEEYYDDFPDVKIKNEEWAQLHPYVKRSIITGSDGIYEITNADGELLGHQDWSGYDLFLSKTNLDGVGLEHRIDDLGWCAVRDFDGKWGIIKLNHQFILPCEFDGDDRFESSIYYREDAGFIARRNGKWMICEFKTSSNYPAFSDKGAILQGEVIINGGHEDRINVREKPDTGAPVVTVVYPGTTYPYYDIKVGNTGKNWYYIWIEADNYYGWVSSGFASIQ